MDKIVLPSGRCIGDGHAPFIVAECGSNWRDLEDCLHSIAMAKAVGADAVKFQLFTTKALYGMPPERAWAIEIGETLRWDAIEMPSALPIDWLPKLKEKADACGIELMCTAFSPELYDAVDPYVSIHKVASAEMTHVRILEKLRQLHKPVILSTGAHGPKDIQKSLITMSENQLDGRYLMTSFKADVILMYCVAAYPARDIDFRHLDELKKLIPLVGYSDHTTDYSIIPKLAVEKGACVIEKHFTDIPEVDTPDRPHSLTVDEFKKMVQSIRGDKPFVWGSGEEKEMITKHNRRLVVIQNIHPGDTFQEGVNFGIYRSLKEDTKGLSPFAIDHVNGKIAKLEIKSGDSIGPGYFLKNKN